MATDYLFAMGAMTSPDMMERSLPPIVDFVNKYDRGSPMYPVQATLLKIVFLDIDGLTEFDRFVIKEWQRETENGGEIRIPLDVIDRMKWCREHGYKNFHEFVFCGGRRGGKGFLGGKIGAYMTARMIAYGNPQRRFGIVDGHDLYCDVLATQYSQAQGMLYNDVRDAVLNNDWLSPYLYKASSREMRFQTPADRHRQEIMEAQAQKSGRKSYVSFASLVVTPSASISSAIRGRASYTQMFDEFAHGLDGVDSKSSSYAVYEAATPSVMQFHGDGLIYIPSSPWSELGKFYDLYQQVFKEDVYGRTENPQMFAIKIPSWRMYDWWEYDYRKRGPIIFSPDVSQEMRSREMQNPESFDVEFRANFAKAENAYLNPKVVASVFAPFPDGSPKNVERSSGKVSVSYRAHADAAVSQDNFCFAMGHKELIDGKWHAFIDVMKTWQPQDFPKDERGVHMIDYTQVMEWLRREFQLFHCYRFSMDQWNSRMIVDQLSKDAREGRTLNPSMQCIVDNHSATENFKRWELFKTACYQGWVHIPRKIEFVHKMGRECCLIEEELKYMVVKNGSKVTWPTTGQMRHGDMADAVSTVVVDLLGSQLGPSDDDLTAVVGAAQGGYNNGMSAQSTEAAMRAGDDMMRRLGYY